MTETGFTSVNGTEFYYEIAGEGQPLALIHAGICDSRMWDDQFEVFARRYRVIRCDLRGYGKTRPVGGEFSHYEDLRGILRHLGIERAILLGCSMGGETCINAALAYPQMVSGLALIGSGLPGHKYGDYVPPQWDEAVAAFKAGDFERVSELEVQVWLDGRGRTPDQVDAKIRDKVREMNLIALRHEGTRGTARKLEPLAAGRLSEIHAPTLVIVGDLDDPGIMGVADTLETGIDGAKKVVMTGTAHLPNMEFPEEFNRIVLDFLVGFS